MRYIDEIVIHATATPPDWRAGQTTAAKVAEVKRWHVEERGWRDIGYHFLVDRNGTVANGRHIEEPGAHVAGHNETTIGIALFGGKDSKATDTFGTHYTPNQETALRDLVRRLRALHPTISRVSGHNEYAAKACPGFSVPVWWNMGLTTPKAEPAPTYAKDAQPWWVRIFYALLNLGR